MIEYRKARRHQASDDIAGASVRCCFWPRPSTTWTAASSGVLAPTLQYKVFHWSDQDYADINIAFKTAYAIGMLCMGAFIDRLGTRIGYTLSIAIWSIFGMLHAAVRPAFGFIGFCVARFGLGLGESGNFPAAIKTVGEWFPKKERALATGIFNAGSNVGAILAPLVIPLIVWPDGTNWQFAFLTTGRLQRPVGALLAEDLPAARGPSAPLDRRTAPTSTAIPWRRPPPASCPGARCCRCRETWAFAAGQDHRCRLVVLSLLGRQVPLRPVRPQHQEPGRCR